MSRTKVFFSTLVFLFFGLFVPMFAANFLFWQNLPIRNEKVGGKVRVVLIEDKRVIQRFANAIRLAFQIPFDLSRYDICFRNKTKIEGAGGTTAVGVKMVITDERDVVLAGPLEIPKNSRVCAEMNINSFFLQISEVEAIQVKRDFLPALFISNYDIAADESIGASPITTSKFVSTFIFFLAYGGMLKLASDYYKWIQRVCRNVHCEKVKNCDCTKLKSLIK